MKFTCFCLSLLLALWAPAQLAASGCEFLCAQELGCSGGCEAFSDECSTVCVGGGCAGECRLIGRGDCDANLAVECDYAPPPEIAGVDAEAVGWSLIRYTEGGGLLAREAETLAGSSEWFMEHAEDLFVELNASEEITEATKGQPTQRKYYLFTQPVTKGCIHYEGSSDSEVAVELAGTAAYYQGTTDGSGNFVDVEVLFSRFPGKNQAVSAFIIDNLHVWSPSTSERLSAFGMLRVGEDGSLSYGFSGVTLAD